MDHINMTEVVKTTIENIEDHRRQPETKMIHFIDMTATKLDSRTIDFHELDNKPRRTGLKETVALEEAAQAVMSAALYLEESTLALTRVFPESTFIIHNIRTSLKTASDNVDSVSTLIEEAILIWKEKFSYSIKVESRENGDILHESDYEINNEESIEDGVPMSQSMEVDDVVNKDDTGVKVECQEYDSKDQVSTVKVLKECKECDFSTNSAKEMRLHVRSHVNLSCTKCEYTTDKRKQLRLHLAKAHGIKEEHTNEHGEKKIKCQDCDYVTGSSASLIRHIEGRHEGKRFKCDICDYTVMHKNNLKEHKATKHLGIRYQCSECPYTATLKRNLKNHVKLKHSTQKQKHFDCNTCAFGTKDLTEIESHIETEHQITQDFDKNYTTTEIEGPATESDNKIVLQTSNSTTKPKSEGQRYYCDKCSYSSTKLVYFQVHVEHKHEGVVYNCDMCTFSTGSRLSLNSHKKRHSQTFYCDQCEYSTWNKLLLKSHNQTKHEKVSIHCDECDFVTTVSYYLTKHKKKMHQANKFQCDRCNFTACYPSDLRIHKNAVHEGVKYSCDQCDFVTRRTGDLNKHKRTVHEGVRYNCAYCMYSATQKRFLEEHVKMKHQDCHWTTAGHQQDLSPPSLPENYTVKKEINIPFTIINNHQTIVKEYI